MHRVRKSFLSVLSALLLLLAALGFAACTQTSKSYTLTLMDGETVYDTVTAEEGSAIQLREDPTRDGWVFEGWYLNADGTGGRQQLPAQMPGEDRTYYAVWSEEQEPVAPTAAYTIRIYLQNLTQDGYDQDETATQTGTAAVNTNITVPEIGGFELNAERSGITGGQVTVSANAADNEFSIYYDRASFTVVYNANAPQGAVAGGNMDEEISGIYGQSFTLAECGYTLNGYRFAGWSTRADGEVEYRPGDSYTLSANGQLYAVWNMGYVNAFGGEDVIYLGEEGVATLERGGRDFTGTYTTSESGVTTFSFTLGNGETLTGEVMNGGRYFAYFGSLEEGSYCFFDSYQHELVPENTITVSGGVSAVWTYVDDAQNTVTYQGVILPDTDENGMYMFVISEGESAGNGFVFRFTTVTNNATGEQYSVFVRRGGEAEIGTVVLAIPSTTNAGSYSLSSNETLVFDGYGNVTYTASSSSYYYYEFIEGGDYDVVSIYGYTSAGVKTEVLRVRLMSFTSGIYGFMPYYEDLDKNFLAGSTSDYLKLDGYGVSGTYTPSGGTPVSGPFTITESNVYSAYIIELAGQMKFLIPITNLGAGSTASVLPYTYGEYVRLGTNSSGEIGLYYPLLVFNANNDNKAQYYYYDSSSGSMLLIGTGVATYDSATGLWTIVNTLESGMESYATLLPLMIEVVLDTENYIYDVYYYTSVGAGENAESYLSTYRAADGATLVVYEIPGRAVYTDAQGNSVQGTLYSSSSTGTYLRYVANGAYAYLYLELNEETGTLTVLDVPNITRYWRGDDWTISQTVTLVLDGKGGAVYTNGDTTENGTYTGVEQADGSYVYTFVGKSGTQFSFLLLTMSSTSVYVVYNSDLAGTLISEDYGVLQLDGFAFEATYTDLAGNTYEGQYAVRDGVIYLNIYDASGTRIDSKTIDLVGTSFTVRDGFHASYLLLENNVMMGSMMITLDGYGGLTYQVGAEIGTDTVHSGTYTILDRENSELSVVIGGNTYRIVLGTANGYNVFTLYDDGAAVYLSSAWEFFMLDGFGSLTYIDERGFVYEGSYTRLAEGVLFMSCDDAISGVYHINAQTGTATYVDNSDYLGLYVADNSSFLYLRTSLSGIDLTQQASLAGYYTVVDGAVTLYLRDSSAQNDYYFTAVTGTYADGVITVGGVAYTLADTYLSTENDGYLIYRADVTGNMTYGAYIYLSDGTLTTEIVLITMSEEDASSIVINLSDGTRYFATVDAEKNAYTITVAAVSMQIEGEAEGEALIVTQYYTLSDESYAYTLSGSVMVGEELVTFDEQDAEQSVEYIYGIIPFTVFSTSFAHSDGYFYDIRLYYSSTFGSIFAYTRYLVSTLTSGDYSITAYQLLESNISSAAAMTVTRLALRYNNTGVSLISLSVTDNDIYRMVSAYGTANAGMYDVVFSYAEDTGVVNGFTLTKYELASASYTSTTVYYAVDAAGKYYAYAYATYTFTSSTEMLTLTTMLDAAPGSYLIMLEYEGQYLLFYFTPDAATNQLAYARMITLTTSGYSVTVFYGADGNVLWLYELNTVAEDGTETEVWNLEKSTEGTVVMTAANTITLTVGGTVYTMTFTANSSGPQTVTVTASAEAAQAA